MTGTIDRLELLLHDGATYISSTSEAELAHKPAPEKWSKKEILGHLIDSAVNNLQRFTEIQFEEKPYPIRKYKQDELVIANDYQNTEMSEIINFWLAINRQILRLMKQQSEMTLSYTIKLPDHEISDLRFLMNDYVDHLEHHLNQIKK